MVPLWLLIVGAVIALAMGVGLAGGGGADPENVNDQAAAPTERVTVRETVTAGPGTVVETVFVTPTPETVEATPPEGDGYTAGRYSFRDVQIMEDFVGDFAGRARVTNTGPTATGVIWTMTVFRGGTVVATLMGSASDFAEGSTITAEFTSLDDYQEWDRLEFQVDTEF